MGILLATLLVTFGSCMSFFGLVLDHHFAERRPTHLHLIQGATELDHVHSYELVHGHDQAVSPGDEGQWDHGLVSLDAALPHDHPATRVDAPPVDLPDVFDTPHAGSLLYPKGEKASYQERLPHGIKRPPSPLALP